MAVAVFGLWRDGRHNFFARFWCVSLGLITLSALKNYRLDVVSSQKCIELPSDFTSFCGVVLAKGNYFAIWSHLFCILRRI